jgi:hypothetical protein
MTEVSMIQKQGCVLPDPAWLLYLHYRFRYSIISHDLIGRKTSLSGMIRYQIFVVRKMHTMGWQEILQGTPLRISIQKQHCSISLPILFVKPRVNTTEYTMNMAFASNNITSMQHPLFQYGLIRLPLMV